MLLITSESSSRYVPRTLYKSYRYWCSKICVLRTGTELLPLQTIGAEQAPKTPITKEGLTLPSGPPRDDSGSASELSAFRVLQFQSPKHTAAVKDVSAAPETSADTGSDPLVSYFSD